MCMCLVIITNFCSERHHMKISLQHSEVHCSECHYMTISQRSEIQSSDRRYFVATDNHAAVSGT